MQTLRILFVIDQLDFADHISLAYLSAIAKQRGHQTFLCILKTTELLKSVSDTRPDIIAYSANIMGFSNIVNANREAQKDFKFISILGGPQATFSPETFAESGMDAYCVGEGEYAFRDFIDRVAKGESFDGIPNLITKAGSWPVRPLIQNLDELPLPDRDLVLANSHLGETEKKTFYATRGCPFQCNYCCNNFYHALYRGKGQISRRFSVERLITEIEDVKSKYRMLFVKFGDDLFAFKADAWLEEFAEKYSKRINIPFNCYLRIDRVDDDLLRLLRKAGCFSVHLSVDSTSQLVREDVLGRKMLNIDIVKTLRRINEFGINTWVNFMLAAPESSLRDDLSAIRLSHEGLVTYASFSTTVPMKGTKLYQLCADRKYIDPATHNGDMSGCTQRSELLCFSEHEKDVRFNIYLVGAILARLPGWLMELGIMLIKNIPPNPLFKWARHRWYDFNIENRIFCLHPKKKPDTAPM